jgi:hypothetical protein
VEGLPQIFAHEAVSGRVSDHRFREEVVTIRTLVYAFAYGCMEGDMATAQQILRLNVEAFCRFFCMVRLCGECEL